MQDVVFTTHSGSGSAVTARGWSATPGPRSSPTSIVRREPLHPGAQQTFDDLDGHRFTAFITDQPDTDTRRHDRDRDQLWWRLRVGRAKAGRGACFSYIRLTSREADVARPVTALGEILDR